MGAAFVDSMIFPVLNIDDSRPIEYHFELVRFEYAQQISRNNFVHGQTQKSQIILDTLGTVEMDPA